MASKEVKQKNDEITLFELIESFWKKKVPIIAITAFVTLIGLSVSFLIPPTYEASVEILPPSTSNIAELNKFEYLQSKSEKEPTKIFSEFLSILRSNKLIKKFLREEGVMKSIFEKETTLEEARKELNETIKLKVPRKGPEDEASFQFQYSDAEQAAKYANQLVGLAIELYRRNLELSFESLKDQKIKKLNDQKSSLVAAYQARLDQEITKLKEAYMIADKLDIIEPQEIKDQSSNTESRSRVVTEEMRYLYRAGTRALNAEIETVTNRKQDLSMVVDWIDIDQELALLDTISFDASRVMPINIDLVAVTPENYIKPNRTLIAIISFVIGGFLAIIFVSIRNVISHKK